MTTPPASPAAPNPVPLDFEAISAALAAARPVVPSALDGARTPVPSGPVLAGRETSSHSGDGPPDGDRGGAGELDRRLAFFPLTDLGNAERFVERWRGKFLWCPALGWLAWDGRRWNRDGAEGLVTTAVHETVRAIRREADAIAGTRLDHVVGMKKKEEVFLSDMLRAWGRASEASAKLAPVAKHAAPYLEVPPAALDADPMKLNLLNGTLAIAVRDGEDYVRFGPHDPADRITKLAPVAWDPEKTCPIYDAFLAEVQPEEHMRRFLHQWGGLSCTGDAGEQKLVFFWGKGKNGKSTLVDAWSHLLGDYAETVPIETFLDQGRGRNAGQATPDLAILPGVRFLRTSEPERGAKLAEALIKLSTGGEAIQARHLNRDYFKYYPQFKLTMSGNYRPSINGTDEGIWRRVLLVPWPVTIAKEKIDRKLGEKLRAEASGILNRLLDGLRDFLDNGLVTPEAVVQATETYRTDSDPLGRFLATCTRQEIGGRVQSTELHRVYAAWAKANGEKEWSPQGLGRALRERGFVSKHSNVIWWLDMALTRNVNDFVDYDGNPLRERDDSS